MKASASRFSASYDTLTKVLSPAVGLVLIAPGFIAGMWWLAILGGAILAVAYAYSVRGYRVEAGSIIVERLVGEVRISVAGCEVRRAHANDLADQ